MCCGWARLAEHLLPTREYPGSNKAINKFNKDQLFTVNCWMEKEAGKDHFSLVNINSHEMTTQLKILLILYRCKKTNCFCH